MEFLVHLWEPIYDHLYDYIGAYMFLEPECHAIMTGAASLAATTERILSGVPVGVRRVVNARTAAFALLELLSEPRRISYQGLRELRRLGVLRPAAVSTTAETMAKMASATSTSSRVKPPALALLRLIAATPAARPAAAADRRCPGARHCRRRVARTGAR